MLTLKRMYRGALALWIIAAPFAFSQTKQEADSAAQWPMFNRDLGSTRYSPLAQINTRNVAQLNRAWSFKIGTQKNSGSITGGSEVTPIVVQGVMYVPTATAIVALEPETGKQLWSYESTGAGNLSRRGVA